MKKIQNLKQNNYKIYKMKAERSNSRTKNGPPSLLKPKTKSKIRPPMDMINLDLPTSKKVTFQQPISPEKVTSKQIGYQPMEPPTGSVNALALSGPGHTMQGKNAKLAGEYAKRHERMQNRLNSEIGKQVFVKNGVKVPVREKIDENKDPVAELEKKLEEDIRKQNEAMGIKSDLDLIPNKEKSHDVYSYHRSQRAVEMRLKDGFDQGVSDIENEKFQLIKKLNENLLKLDQMNEEKRSLSMTLINQIKFVRQLQSNLGTSDNGHITEVIDKDLEAQFKKEKHLNIQLKEKLKECELEKERIKEQLQFLEGQKDVVVVTKTGGHMDIETSSMSINEMLRYRDTILKNLEEAQRDVELLRIEEINVVRTMDELHHKLETTYQERVKLAHDIQNLKLKADDGTALILRDSNDLRFELRRQKNLLAAKVIANAILKGVKSWKKANFQNLALQLKYDDQQIGAILAFRKICLTFNHKRQEKYFNLWFSRGMRPNSLLKQNREITNFQLKNMFMKLTLNKWQNQTIIENKKASRNSQKVLTLGEVLQNFHTRQQKYTIALWHRNTNNLKLMSQKLAIFCRDRINFRIQQAFLKWNNFILHQDLMIRLKSQCVRSSAIQFKTQVFQGWFRVSKQFKQDRINLQIRVWNQLKANLDRNRYKKRGTQAVLKNEIEIQQFYQRAAFDGIKQNWVSEKYGKVNSKLRGEVDPAINEARSHNQWKHDRMKFKRDSRLMDVIITGFGRGVFSFFHKWKFETQEYKRIVKQKIILKCYRAYMKSAIEKWKNQVVLKQKQVKNLTINSIEKNNMQMQGDIQVTANKIQHAIETCNSKGQRLTKKVMYNLYLRYMKTRFDQWMAQIINFRTKESALEKIIVVKMSRRIQRLAFKWYVQRTKEATWNLNSIRKSGDYHGFIKYNATKRMFNAFKGFVMKFITAKKCLRRAVMNSDLRTKKDFFQLWYREHVFDISSERVSNQNQKVSQIQDKRTEEGEVRNTNYEFEQKVSSLYKKFQSLSRKTIAKLICNFKRYQTYTYLNKWKEKVMVYNRYRTLVKYSIMQRLMCRVKHVGFQTWSQNANVIKKRKFMDIIQEEMQIQKFEEETIDQIQKSRQILVETQNKKLDYLTFEQKYAYTKIDNVIGQITRIENGFFKIKRRQHVFNLWKNYCYDKQRYCKRLEVLMKKNSRQIAFDAIREKAWGIKVNTVMTKRLSKIIWAWQNSRKFALLTRWKQQCFFDVTGKQKQMETTLFHRIKNDQFSREKNQNGVVNSQYNTFQRKIMKKIFISLFDYKCKKTYAKIMHDKMQDKLQTLLARMAVQKWKSRSRKSVFCRSLARNYINQNKQKFKRMCFDLIKKEYVLKSFIFKKLLNASQVLNKEHQRFALSQMKQLKYQRQISKINNRRNSRDMLGKIMRNWQDVTLKKYFDNMKFKTLCNLQRIDVMKSIVKNQFVQTYRSFFMKWKDQTEKLRVVEDVDEHGYVRIQEKRITRDVINMKALLIDEERYMPEEVKTIIKDDDKKFKDETERVLCRLYTYSISQTQKSENWLLIWCIDKLKQNVRDKRAYRFWMKYLEFKAEPLNVKKAFDQLIINKNSRKDSLAHLKYKYLVKLDRQNRDTLHDLNSRMAKYTHTISDLKGQRDFLIGKMVSSQKLAIIRCNWSLKFAKEKAFKRLRDNAFREEKKQVNYLTNDNFGSMDALKERLSYLEKSNILLDQENDKLRQGAVNSIHLISTAEEVQGELEILNKDLTSKAQMIRKLLEDNTLLNKRLQAIDKQKKMKKSKWVEY